MVRERGPTLAMSTFGPQEIKRILEVVDDLGLHREAVLVPLDTAGEGRVRLMEPGKVEIVAPEEGDFESWVAGLRDRLLELDLSRVPRSELP